MKKLLVVLAAVAMSTGAFAQKHMVTVDGSNLDGFLSWNSTKEKGSSSSETKDRLLSLNYAYTLTSKFQLGGKLNYAKSSFDNGTDESYGFRVGAIYNHGKDIRSSYYASLYLGMDWVNQYGAQGRGAGEVLFTEVAVGKRIPLTMISENFVYSPELTWVSANPTTSIQTEWSQGFAVKFLNFSVFF